MSNRHFQHSIETSASAEAVWSLWTDPTTWASWDLGLRSATGSRLELGATGEIVSLEGRRAQFQITEWDKGRAYAFETRLPLARLVVRRSLAAGSCVRVTHDVRFAGPLAWFWAALFGATFRKALPPTMARLTELAEAQP